MWSVPEQYDYGKWKTKPDFLTKIITLDGLIKDSNWDDLSTNTLDALEKRQEQDLLHAWFVHKKYRKYLNVKKECAGIVNVFFYTMKKINWELKS
jgi:hypothetical protein